MKENMTGDKTKRQDRQWTIRCTN